MKKNILFIISNMESGGVSKSMSSLLNIIDKEKYDIDLLITNPIGIYMELLPNSINIIKDKKTMMLMSSFPVNLLKLIQKGFLFTACIRFFSAFFMLFDKGIGGWILSRGIIRIKKKYDLAIDYNGQHQLYYLVDFINAKKKVSFFHSDYEKWDYYLSMDRKYYPKVDSIFTISNICVKSLKEYFPNVQNKISLFENITSPNLIEKLSNEEVNINKNSILSIGHLSEAKGTLLALQVAKILKDKNIIFTWYFIGEDSRDNDYNKYVKEYGIEKNIIFLGLLVNPYPYMKNVKIISHLSKYEGRSIALDEAKILEKPIVVTNFSTVSDQFKNRVNATICDFDSEEIANAIIELFENKYLCNKYSSNLHAEKVDNSNEVQKLYNLLK